MQINQLFNPEGSDLKEHRQIWFGNPTNLINLNDVRYEWAIALWKGMRENFWVAEKIDLAQDVVNYSQLTTGERRGYEGILSYLTFLDSIQVMNLPNLKSPITAPELHLPFSEQQSQEGLHNQSYQYLIESIIPKERRNQVYDFWRDDHILKERCKFIASYYQSYVDNPTEENYFIALIADYLLESLLFYNGFIFYYNLASRQLMPGSADIFKYINRDELSHVRLFQGLIAEALNIFPHSVDQIYEMFDTAVNNEILWTNHIINNEVLGITEDSTEQYSKYLANIRLGAIGLQALYPDEKFKKSPYRHLERFADTKKDANVKANFFEAGVTSYNISSGLTGWDKI